MHEGLCRCTDFTRLLAIALLNWSDDEGYFMANPILIRGQVFPFLDDSKIIPRSLQDLSRVGWIELGIDDQGRDVGMIKNFAKHQRVDKPKASSIKGNFQFRDESKIDLRRIQDASKEEGKGREGNREEERNGKEPLPYESKEFVDAWGNWLRHKKAIKQKLPQTTISGQFKNLAKWGESNAIQSIENSISNNWRGLFEIQPKGSSKPAGGNHAGFSDMKFTGEEF